MALWECLSCGTKYAVGLTACPHCRSTEWTEDGVAKITTWGGPSQDGDLERLTREAAAEAEAAGSGAEGDAATGVAEPAGEDAAEPDAPEPSAEAGGVPEPVPVAVQKAAGVPPEETVTVADQKAGVPPPPLPPPPAKKAP